MKLEVKAGVKENLIRSAIEVFAQQGYRGGKIADIVKGAGANIAAVNYHFGSKDKLFVAALRQAHRKADEIYPSSGGLAEDASAKEKIGAAARAILRRSFDVGVAGDFNRIMSRTMNVVGSPIEMILEEVEQLELKHISTVIAEFLNTTSEQMISWGVAVFLSLATMVSKCPAGVVNKIFQSEDEERPSESQIDAMIQSQINAIFVALDSLPKKLPA